MDRAVLEIEIHKLWDVLPHPTHSVVRWMARRDASIVGGYSATPEGLIRTAWNLRSYNLYVQVNPTTRRQGVRCSAMDISHWSFFLIDIDPVEERFNSGNAAYAFNQRFNDHMGLEQLAPTVIDSGRGFQLWYRLNDIKLHTEDDRMKVRHAAGAALQALSRERISGCVVDTSCSDLPRVMRMPGSVNQKTGQQARIVSRGLLHGNLGQYLLDKAPPVDYGVRPHVVGLRQWQQLLPYLTAKAERFINYGVEEPGRHNACVAAAASLRDYGLTPDEARPALYLGARRCTPRLYGPEIERILETVWRKRPMGSVPEGATKIASP